MKVLILKTIFFRKKNVHTIFVVRSYNINVLVDFCNQFSLISLIVRPAVSPSAKLKNVAQIRRGGSLTPYNVRLIYNNYSKFILLIQTFLGLK